MIDFKALGLCVVATNATSSFSSASKSACLSLSSDSVIESIGFSTDCKSPILEISASALEAAYKLMLRVKNVIINVLNAKCDFFITFLTEVNVC